MDFDYDALRSAFLANVPKHGCPACQSNRWDGPDTIVRLEVIDHRAQGNGHPPDPTAQRSMVAAPLTCGRCGLIHLYEVWTVMGKRPLDEPA